MTLYCTLSDAKADDGATGITGDNYLLRAIRTVSRRVDREFAAKRPLFAPVIEARKVRVDGYHVNSWDNTLRLDGSLLALTAATVGSTALVVGTNVSGYPDVDMPPFPYLRLTQCGSRGWYYTDCADCSAPLYATITGIWGVHRDYANAWQLADTLSAGINASVTTLTVADIDGADVYGVTPRISAGNLLKIDDEFLEVIATSTATNAATVRRGVNGSTAAAHALSAPVYVWQIEEPIRAVVARQAAMIYARKGAFTTVEISGMSEVRYPADLLPELRAVLQEYAYVH